IVGAAPATIASATAPAAATDGKSYTVKSGDSLWKIAKANNTTVSAIKQANSLSGDALKVGQQLRIPSASATAAASASAATPAPDVRAGVATPAGYNSEWNTPGTSFTDNGKFYHIVDFNESLGSIASKYGVSLGQLKSANNITG